MNIPESLKTRKATILLAGNPNCGKSCTYNLLTGSRGNVGNYPGVTVERHSGQLIHAHDVTIVDLPGTYSLSSFSPEEQVAVDELQNNPDLVVVVVDSTQLRRSMVLMTQIMQMGKKIVLCLNMSDEAETNGLRIDAKQMSALLGFPVVKTTSNKGIGIDDLVKAIDESLSDNKPVNHKLVLGELNDVLEKIIKKFPQDQQKRQDKSWLATKMLLREEKALKVLIPEKDEVSYAPAMAEVEIQHKDIKEHYHRDPALFVSEHYAGFISGLLRETVTTVPVNNHHLTDTIDSVVVHPVLGLPIFALIMYFIFWLTFALGEYPMGWLEDLFAWLGEVVSGLWEPGSDSLLKSLLVDGIIGGVGGVLVFLPNIILLFLGLSFLEDSGYMARAAYLTDKLMHRFGLHGKSFIPLITGFGCTVPAIMATRTLENERDRLITMLVLPLISCGARFPIWMLLIPAFFPEAWRAPVLFSIYLIGIVMALILALTLRKTMFKGMDAPFVMELPPYRMPTLHGILTKVLERSLAYLKKAGTIILGVSILLWAATTFPRTENFHVDEQIAAHDATVANLTDEQIEAMRTEESMENSIAGHVGKALEPIFSPLGFDWKINTALIGAFAAKEVFVAQMSIIYSMGNEDTEEDSSSLAKVISEHYDIGVGISLILFLLIATPCMATFAITKRESARVSWAVLQFGGLTAIAYVLCLIVFQISRLFI